MRIFEKIEKENANTEYNKTEVEDRKHRLNHQVAKQTYSLNKSMDIRILDKIDSMGSN